MNLGIFLSSGDSFEGMAKVGQDIRFKTFYISKFARSFKKVYIFSYANEKVDDLPKNVILISNKYNIHRLLYGFLMPFLNYSAIRECQVFRCYHLLGTLPGIMTTIFFRKPYVFNYGYDYKEFTVIEKKYLQYVLLLLIHPVANFFAKRIIAVTKMVLDWTPKEKTSYIPNGVDINVFKSLKIKKKRRKLVLFSVGRLEPQKNYENTIPALKGLNISYVIVGRGFLKDKIEKLAKNNKVDLKIIERVKNTDLPKYYNDADIFMLPSLTEGPVKVLLEAMACGLPVVGSEVNGIKEILVDGENGIVCTIETKSIKNAVQRLLNDEKLRVKISRNARRYIEQNHVISILLKEEINLLKKALKND